MGEVYHTIILVCISTIAYTKVMTFAMQALGIKITHTLSVLTFFTDSVYEDFATRQYRCQHKHNYTFQQCEHHCERQHFANGLEGAPVCLSIMYHVLVRTYVRTYDLWHNTAPALPTTPNLTKKAEHENYSLSQSD